METVGVYVVPVTCSDEVTESVLVTVCSYLGVSRSTRCEEHEIWLASAGELFGVCGTVENVAESRHLLVEISPALALAVSHHLYEADTQLLLGKVHLMSNVAVARTYDSLYACRLEAVCEVMLHQLICSRDNYCTYLVESKYGEPELIVSLEHQHNSVALLYAL